MEQPLGCTTYVAKNGKTYRKRVYGISQCRRFCCHTTWSRDFAAAINIGEAFLALWRGQTRPAYLRPDSQVEGE